MVPSEAWGRVKVKGGVYRPSYWPSIGRGVVVAHTAVISKRTPTAPAGELSTAGG